MPIRIYALAKELGIDNKKLVDICTRAGITGKGSALASLTDEEVVQLRVFMSGAGGRRAGPAASAPTSRAGEAAARTFRREDYIAPTGTMGGKVPVLADKPPAAKKSPEETAAPPKPVEKKPPEKPAPAINLAPMPAAQKSPQKPRPAEPVPQKPDIRLPPDAIRAGKAGTTPLFEHVRKHEEKKKEAAVKKSSPRQPASAEAGAVAGVPGEAAPTRERPR
ncbi:MAG: translation initiation factor IF-2 N-terminal domain-containing protein, partial [Thermoguttaceae bacterium]